MAGLNGPELTFSYKLSVLTNKRIKNKYALTYLGYFLCLSLQTFQLLLVKSELLVMIIFL